MRRFLKSATWKGYSLGKMVSLGQKLKFRKTREKRFFNHIRLVLCKTPLENTPNIREMRRFLKVGHRAKALAKWSVWVKNSNSEKHAKNDSLITLDLFCAKNRVRKHQRFEK